MRMTAPIKSPAVSGACRRARGVTAAPVIVALIGLAACWASAAEASGLECPQAEGGAAPALAFDDGQIKRMTTGNDADLANEIGGLIGRMKGQYPAASYDAITNALITAYCPVVAQKADASPVQKWQLVRQFDRVLMQQVAAAAMPQGAMVIANIPLAPTVYQKLTGQAQASGQTTTDLMAAILARAAGQ
jgi:hypothetical protein